MPKISVIIPVYNVEQYLAQCLDSVIAQTFSDIEIICINDGSTDNSGQILSEYAKKDKRIKIITQENSGLSQTRNNGIKVASGKYVCFIDSDDYIDVEYLRTLLNLLENSGADIAMAGMRIVNGDSISANVTANIITENFSTKLNNFPNGSVCDKLFKTDLFRKNALEFPRGRYYEDNIVLLKLAYLSGVVAFTNSVSYYYFMNPMGICRSDSPQQHKKRQQDKLYIAKQLVDFAKNNKIVGADMYSVKHFVVRTVAADFLRKNSEYYSQIKQILGVNFIYSLKVKKLIKKIARFFWRVNVDSLGIKTYKVLKIPIYSTRGTL